MTLTAQAVQKELQILGTPAKAKASAWFFKTKKGEYGYGDKFFGVTVPEQRTVAKRYRLLPLEQIVLLLKSPVHECRLTALLILVEQYRTATSKERSRVVRVYLKHLERVNNWDLVDSSAPYILGDYLRDKNRRRLYTFARSRNVWKRRIAIVATAAFISRGEFDDTLALAALLIHDKQDLIHKATGWMLREVGKRSLIAEERFLKRYASRMPRTMLRYAIEKFPEKKRKMYLSL